ncbi:SRPBCC domain-containing protein [Rhizobacter sp. Root404]|uniref:SRPBCC family protein n=1 Tax=Rhizobacter sp. Root404 TaxID=1736528 RepID=UPI0006FE256D|nr:SRPBCC domain-containing protein [Rhizobacter sp. Root404]KQW37882.1 ATPase [Rhizobacter sp. Root404]
MPTTAAATQTAASVRIDRHYRAAPEKVWRAWTDPQALSCWFGPGEQPSLVTADLDVREGGRFVLAFKTPDGETQQASGVYQTVEPARRLVFSWTWKGTPERISRISIALTPAGDGGTDLSFVHDRFFDDTSRANHERGWQLFFVNLDRFVRQQEERSA